MPWSITLIALWIAFRGIDWVDLSNNLKNTNPRWVIAAIILTSFSYILRSIRWLFLFPEGKVAFFDSLRVLILGFFMNNILPARAGELVRAHVGGKIMGKRGTTVLATIASERLADGLTISFMFLIFSAALHDYSYSKGLFLVSMIFAGISMATIIVLFFRHKLFGSIEKKASKTTRPATRYALERVKIFLEGLEPLINPVSIIIIALWSGAIWSVELGVYYCVTNAFDQMLSLPECAVFLVAVNFSSLIPAAPGGLGTIEAISSHILQVMGITRETALSMVITQHLIQYLVVALPGLLIMLKLRKLISQAQAENQIEREAPPVNSAVNS